MLKKSSIRNNLFIFLLLVLEFLIGLLYYDSSQGTDFNQYGKYLFSLIGYENISINLEQGIGYFWLVQEVFNFFESGLYVEPNLAKEIATVSIQFVNFLLFCGGLIGVRKLMYDENYNSSEIFVGSLAFITFMPLFGNRLIYKPENLAIFVIPWLLIVIKKINSKNLLFDYLILTVMLSLMFTSKASIALPFLLICFMYFKKDRLVIKKSLFFVFPGLFLFYLLQIESYEFTSKYLWQFDSLDGYDDKAGIGYLLNINFPELINNPFRNIHANSFFGIILLDTFGDYWENLWLNPKAWLFYKNPNIQKISIYTISSLIFYIYIFTQIYRRNTEGLNKYNYLILIGFFTILINNFGIVTNNFNPLKGDPTKTQMISFLLIFSFINFILFIYKKLKISKYIFAMLLLLFQFNLIGIDNDFKLTNEKVGAKVFILSNCKLNTGGIEYYDEYINWCSEKEKILTICGESKSYYLEPEVAEEGYLIFKDDLGFDDFLMTNKNDDVLIRGYLECDHYVKAGFFPVESKKYLYEKENPKYFLTLFSILSFFIFFKYLIKDNVFRTKN